MIPLQSYFKACNNALKLMSTTSVDTKIFKHSLGILLMMLLSSQTYAQDTEAKDYTFLKTIDQVDIYFTQIFCDDNVEYLVIKVINKSTSSVSLNLQPTFKIEDTSFNSSAPVSFTLSGGATITGDCNTSNLRVSIFEFFSQYDSSSMTFDLTKI